LDVTKGFSRASSILSRQAAADFALVPPALRRKLKEMFGTESPEEVVRQIISEVRDRGDKALFDLTLKIDRIELASLEIGREEIAGAYREVDDGLVAALKLAAERIRAFHEVQRAGLGEGFSAAGVGQMVRPLERVGVYAPGGSFAYPSTVLMTAVPAGVAGVKEIILATSPRAGGRVPPLTLVAADIAGVSRVFGIGGAQAIASVSAGRRRLPRWPTAPARFPGWTKSAGRAISSWCWLKRWSTAQLISMAFKGPARC